jgi:membrane fusion protein, multidrug efflux system
MTETTETPPTAETAIPASPTRRERAKRLRLPLMLGGVAIVLVGALFVYLTGGRYQATDDSYVRVASVGVSSDIGGRVKQVYVHENQRVTAGQILFTLDSQPAQVALNEAAASLASAQQHIREDEAAYRQKQVELQQASETARFRATDQARDANLLKVGALSRAEYDEAVHQTELAQRQVGVVRQQMAAVAARLGGGAKGDTAHPEVRQAAAAIARARLQEGYTVVRAPQNGVVTKVEQLQVGDTINASTPVFNLVTDDVWVEAAFKENQLNYMRPGQTATVSVDAYPGHRFTARIDSIAPGTDQTFSALPAENASGNWVKVVQRVPVRLHFTRRPDIPLQGGLSAKVKVDTAHSRSLAGLFGGR